METMKNINRRTGVTGSRGMGTLKKYAKENSSKKTHYNRNKELFNWTNY